MAKENTNGIRYIHLWALGGEQHEKLTKKGWRLKNRFLVRYECCRYGGTQGLEMQVRSCLSFAAEETVAWLRANVLVTRSRC